MNRRSPGKAPLRDKLRAAVSAEILDAAEAVIAEHGVAKASIVAIAARAGVAVGTLYNYFPDRDAIVAALFRERRAQIAPAIRAALTATHGDFEQRLGQFLEHVLLAMDQHRRFVKVAVETDARPPPDGKKSSRPTLTELHACFTELLAAGVVEDVIDPATAELAAPMMVAAFKGVIAHQLAAGAPFADQGPALARLFLDGARKR